MLTARLQRILDTKIVQHQRRSLVCRDETNGSLISLKGKSLVSFASNNYLGLAHHPKVIKACHHAIEKYGVGSGSAYLVSGYTRAHQALEEQLADFLDYPKVLLFSSGYLVNLGVISALFSREDEIFADRLIHASLIDGCLQSHATFKRYPHGNYHALAALCQHAKSAIKLIVTEGLFGMDGSIAKLDEVAKIANQYQATLLLDDAHGIGLLGQHGRGSMELFGLTSKDIPLLTGAFGKTFGTYGAFVAGSELLIDSLLQLTRTYTYTTAIPPSLAAASLASLQVLIAESWRREQLMDTVKYFQQGARALGLQCAEFLTPIQPIIIGDSKKTLAISHQLFEKGLYVKAIRPPTVPHGTARLRITLSIDHTRQQVDQLLEALSHAIKTA